MAQAPKFKIFDHNRKWRERNIVDLRKLGMPEEEIQRMIAG